MSVYIRQDSKFYWMTLEGHARKESTRIRHDASSAAVRKALRDQAEQVYHARMVQLARARVGLPVETGVTFSEFRKWYDQHKATRHRAADRTRRILDSLEAHFGPTILSDIKPARWTEYESTRLKAGLNPNTIGRELATMKAFLNAAVGQHLEVNPLVHVKRTTKRLPPKRTITADEEAAAGGARPRQAPRRHLRRRGDARPVRPRRRHAAPPGESDLVATEAPPGFTYRR
jgi:hypothetical protein